MTETRIKNAFSLGLWIAFGFFAVRGLYKVAEILEPRLPVETRQFLPYGETDSEEDAKRSGLELRFDHGTGCQYLVTRQGHITPRLGRDGKQICE